MKDKNGKEIKDGDCIRFVNNEVDIRYNICSPVVEINGELMCWDETAIGGKYRTLKIFDTSKMEIVGTICMHSVAHDRLSSPDY